MEFLRGASLPVKSEALVIMMREKGENVFAPKEEYGEIILQSRKCESVFTEKTKLTDFSGNGDMETSGYKRDGDASLWTGEGGI